MSLILDELSRSVGDLAELIRVALRLFAAMIAGAVIGYQRERSGKAAGLRTHMLVCMGTTLFVVAGMQIGMEQDALSRVIQGLATGIGPHRGLHGPSDALQFSTRPARNSPVG